MGHKRPYDKVSWEHIKERYLMAVPYLSIDRGAASSQKASLENLEMREQIRQLQRNQARILEMLEKGAKVDSRLLNLNPDDVGDSALR